MLVFLLMPHLTSPFYSFMVDSAKHVDTCIRMEHVGLNTK
jgi:hypothetical protein